MQYYGFKFERTKSGYPALWEQGGGASNTGEATIICDKNGQPKRAVYQRRKGHLSNAEHALIIVECGDYIITAFHHRRDYTIRIYRIVAFRDSEEYAITEMVHEFSRGEWNSEPPEFLKAAVQAAQNKASCYHCREAHFIRED